MKHLLASVVVALVVPVVVAAQSAVGDPPRTRLTGTFDGNLEWTPDRMPAPSPGGAPPGALPPPPTGGPSIFTAVQEHLGLKLESTRGPVDVLVIDRVEQPTPD
jgi:bla regulator protein blaR1